MVRSSSSAERSGSSLNSAAIGGAGGRGPGLDDQGQGAVEFVDRASAAAPAERTVSGPAAASAGSVTRNLRVQPARRVAGSAAGTRRACSRRVGIVHLPPLHEARSPGVRSAILAAMKLVVAIVHNEDAGVLVDALLEREYRATRLHSSGGFLKQSNATVIVGVEDAQVDEVITIVRENCNSRTQVVNPMPPIMEPGEFFMPYPLEVEVGGATVFVLPVERFERL